jgi:cytochrome c biogenesis protein CcmG/thiol:disulfide interchange protein DsbE
MRKILLWSPFVLCVGLFVAFYAGLQRPDDHVIASQIVGQRLPQFAAAPAFAGKPGTADSDFADGRPRLLNIFASWCVPCRAEMPMLLRLQAQGVEIRSVAVHDNVADLQAFLAANGNPYASIGLDDAGRAQLAFGASGVPETFLVDGQGRVLHQYVGGIREEDLPDLMRALGKGT